MTLTLCLLACLCRADGPPATVPSSEALTAVGSPQTDPRDLAAVSPDPAMRRYMAAVLARQDDAHSFVLLWQLSADSDASVRQAAFNAAQSERCAREAPALCSGLLSFFTHDGERDIAWQARDLLLARDLDLALDDADKDYKLDLLAKLGGAPTMSATQTRHILRSLSHDDDIDVQDNAAWLLEQQP